MKDKNRKHLPRVEGVPSREAIAKLLKSAGRPLKRRAIAEHFELSGDAREALRRRLKAMIRDGQLIQNRRSAFGLVKSMDLVAGRIHAHPDGYGFLIPDEGGEDLYLSPRQMRRVLHQDRALVCVTGIDRRGRREGAIVEVLERAHTQIVGRFVEESGVAMVVPDDPRIHQDVLIPLDKTIGARPGQIVVAALDEQPDSRRSPVGHITEILGRAGAPGMAVEIAIRNFSLRDEFPEAALDQAEALGEHIDSADLQGRKDLRALPLVTIDGADARDFDDAVYCEAADKGWRLIVAIADVAHYVEPGSPLDSEAVERGTSVYFPGRVLPMLPEALSNGLCSLKPDVDRYCVVCDMTLDTQGRVKRSRFYRAVMHSHARLTYEQAQSMLSDPVEPRRQVNAEVTRSLDALHALYGKLRQQRQARGAIDFRGHEVMFQFGSAGQVDGILPYPRFDTHRLIEECMIAANVEAAKFIDRQDFSGIFRVHEAPPEERVENVKTLLQAQGIRVQWRERVTPADFADVLQRIADRPDRDLIEAVLLRAQSLAVYQPENRGHFGLSLTHYTHFTSPIRRYPDLLVHRAIHHALARKPVSAYAINGERMQQLAQRCSVTERRAEEAERDVRERLKCAFMEQHVGEVFSGTVTGVTSFGLFVELDDTRVSGLVHVTGLPNDYYHFDPVRHQLSGERRGMTFRLADRVTVKVGSVNVDERKVDFEWIGDGNGKD